MNEIDYKKIDIFRVAILGSAGVGKTSIISRLINNSFSAIYEPTYEMT
jgi:GTPase SAR1 family protein